MTHTLVRRMTKDRLIDVLVLCLVAIGVIALVERAILDKESITVVATKAVESLALPVAVAIRLLKWLNDERLELVKQIDNVRSLALGNRDGYQGLTERLTVGREDIDDLSDRLNVLSNTHDRRLVQLETAGGLMRRIDALEQRLTESDLRMQRFILNNSQGELND